MTPAQPRNSKGRLEDRLRRNVETMKRSELAHGLAVSPTPSTDAAMDADELSRVDTYEHSVLSLKSLGSLPKEDAIGSWATFLYGGLEKTVGTVATAPAVTGNAVKSFARSSSDASLKVLKAADKAIQPRKYQRMWQRAAVVIQARARGAARRRHDKACVNAATVLQAAARAHVARIQVAQHRMDASSPRGKCLLPGSPTSVIFGGPPLPPPRHRARGKKATTNSIVGPALFFSAALLLFLATCLAAGLGTSATNAPPAPPVVHLAPAAMPPPPAPQQGMRRTLVPRKRVVLVPLSAVAVAVHPTVHAAMSAALGSPMTAPPVAALAGAPASAVPVGKLVMGGAAALVGLAARVVPAARVVVPATRLTQQAVTLGARVGPVLASLARARARAVSAVAAAANVGQGAWAGGIGVAAAVLFSA